MITSLLNRASRPRSIQSGGRQRRGVRGVDRAAVPQFDRIAPALFRSWLRFREARRGSRQAVPIVWRAARGGGRRRGRAAPPPPLPLADPEGPVLGPALGLGRVVMRDQMVEVVEVTLEALLDLA